MATAAVAVEAEPEEATMRLQQVPQVEVAVVVAPSLRWFPSPWSRIRFIQLPLELVELQRGSEQPPITLQVLLVAMEVIRPSDLWRPSLEPLEPVAVKPAELQFFPQLVAGIQRDWALRLRRTITTQTITLRPSMLCSAVVEMVDFTIIRPPIMQAKSDTLRMLERPPLPREELLEPQTQEQVGVVEVVEETVPKVPEGMAERAEMDPRLLEPMGQRVQLPPRTPVVVVAAAGQGDKVQLLLGMAGMAGMAGPAN